MTTISWHLVLFIAIEIFILWALLIKWNIYEYNWDRGDDLASTTVLFIALTYPLAIYGGIFWW